MSRSYRLLVLAEVRYGRASVDQALDQAQQLVDNKQRILHAQFGIK